jgi:hypothetical protein
MGSQCPSRVDTALSVTDFFNGIGQKLLLPQCNSNNRFTSISEHNAGRILPALHTGLGSFPVEKIGTAHFGRCGAFLHLASS